MKRSGNFVYLYGYNVCVCVCVRTCACTHVTTRFQPSFRECIIALRFTSFHWISYQHKSEIFTGRIDAKSSTERTKEFFSISASFLSVCSLL